MPTEAEKSVYPHSSPAGKEIPYDVGDPSGLFIVDFTGAASAEKDLGSDWEIAVLYATEACVIGFGASVTLNLNRDVVKLDHQIIPKDTPVSVKIPNSKFKVIGISASGILFVQRYRRWQALTTEALQTRIG